MKKEVKNRTVEKLKIELNFLKEEIKNEFIGSVVASFGFIIILIWIDTIQSCISEFLINRGLIEKVFCIKLCLQLLL